ncbi:hypothetical protein FRB95_004685 [Tulasnella sp. JGI-2019a]|nr:hypothetical protein FRB95_004685 [Tulasnella sp. JGI-2019a]
MGAQSEAMREVGSGEGGMNGETVSSRMYSACDPLSPTSEYSSEDSYYASYNNARINPFLGLMPGDKSSSPPPQHFLPHWVADYTSVSHAYLPSVPSSSSLSRYAYDSKYYSQLPLTNGSGVVSYEPGYAASAAVAPNTLQTHGASSSSFPPNSSATHASLHSGSVRGGRGSVPNYSGDYPAETSAHDALLDSYFPTSRVQATQSYSQSRHQEYEPESESSYSDPPPSTYNGPMINKTDDTPISLPSFNDMVAHRPTSPLGPTRSSHRKPREQAAPYRRELRRAGPVTNLKKANANASPTFPTRTQHDSLPSVEVPPSPQPSPSPEYSPPLRGKQSSSRSPKATKKGKEGALDKSFICQICQASFARNHDLTRHYTGHDKVKAHRCNGCDRSFTRKDALKRHSQTKDCGDAQNGEPTGWLKRKAVRKAREQALNEHDQPEDEDVQLSMPPQHPPAAPITAPTSGRNNSVSGASRAPLFATRTSARDAAAPYPVSSVGGRLREMSPSSDQHLAGSSTSRAVGRPSRHHVKSNDQSTSTVMGRGDPVSTSVHVRLSAALGPEQQRIHTGRPVHHNTNHYASLPATAHQLRSGTTSFDAGLSTFSANGATIATTTAPQDYNGSMEEYGSSYVADSALAQWNAALQDQYRR